jgi:DNA-binding transcriptional MocR family regulator
MLWIELPTQVDGFCVYREALQKNVSIMPGTIFSPSARFRNHIRLSCKRPWSEKLDQAVQTLGQICRKQIGS